MSGARASGRKTVVHSGANPRSRAERAAHYGHYADQFRVLADDEPNPTASHGADEARAALRPAGIPQQTEVIIPALIGARDCVIPAGRGLCDNLCAGHSDRAVRRSPMSDAAEKTAENLGYHAHITTRRRRARSPSGFAPRSARSSELRSTGSATARSDRIRSPMCSSSSSPRNSRGLCRF